MERSGGKYPAIFASLDFALLAGAVVILVLPRIVDLYRQDHAQAMTAYAAFSAVTAGLEESSRFAAGCPLILAGWAALRARDLPRLLAYFGILVGVDQLLEAPDRCIRTAEERNRGSCLPP
jgi:hypothetical protein